jgi:uroporphyrin-III C-methyltransferase/precorrin-2 dehydrogenase/sirohydrochlorin ferrochelatase
LQNPPGLFVDWDMSQLLPLFLDVDGRHVLLVGGGSVAAAKLTQLLAVRARVQVVAPEVCDSIERAGVPITRRAFDPVDLDGMWLAVAAATPDVNRQVAEAAQTRRIFVNAVDDPAHASAFMGGVVRRAGVTIAVSTGGGAPALASLVRQGVDALLPQELSSWSTEARRQRARWRRDSVPIEARRPLLLEALNNLYRPSGQQERFGVLGASTGITRRRAKAKPSDGSVILIGAGPGDPGLLTRRAVGHLRAADLVLYDALIDRRVLKIARRAQCFFVGKRAGHQAVSQHAINTVMIQAARRGKRVVRLKGGDPFLFGRGGEEARAVVQAGVRVDIVPGVTSAVAAPALAGIPVTHRGVSSALLVVGGHDEEAFASAVENVAPATVTLVILMGMRRQAKLASRLIALGWSQETPVAVVVDASGPSQAVWRGSLQSLAQDQMDPDRERPGTIIVGSVVDLAVFEAEAGRAGGPADQVLRRTKKRGRGWQL